MKTIYYNGFLITMNEENKFAEAICVEDGKIVAIGSNEEIMACKEEDTEVIDLKNKVMMPGFIDPHSHFFGMVNSLTECDLTDATSFDEIVQMLKDFIEENHIPEGEWVGGRNYDQNFLKEGRHPTKDVLDRVSTKHKIMITHVSNHMGSANSLALADKHVDANMPDPSGGKIQRMEGSMEPTGFLEENAFLHIMHGSASPKREEIIKNVQKAQEIYASNGITTIQDAMVTEPLYHILTSIADANMLYIDVVGYVDVLEGQKFFTKDNPFLNKYHNRFKIGGYKIFLDGSPQGCTAWMSQPYVGQKDFRGYPIYSDEDVEKYIEVAMRDHQQIACHANGDAAAEQFITLFEKVKEKHHLTDLYHPILVHCQFTRKDQLERMVPLGMIPTFFVAHTYYWGDVHVKNTGKERGEKISSVRDALKLGMKYTFHQDSPVVPPNMMKTIWCAVNRISRGGNLIGNEQRIGVYDALKGITIHGAYQYGEQDQKGSLEVGKQANMVILSDNPLTIDPMELDQIQVEQTIIQGNVVYTK